MSTKEKEKFAITCFIWESETSSIEAIILTALISLIRKVACLN